MIGYNLLLSSTDNNPELQFLQEQGITDSQLKTFQKYKVWGLRRKLWALPQQAQYRFEGEDVRMSFVLES